MAVAAVWKRHATRIGLVSALVALLLWPAYAALQEPLRWPFVAALLLTALSGLSILAIACADLLTIRRGRNAQAARTFDLALGLLLAAPPALALAELFA